MSVYFTEDTLYVQVAPQTPNLLVAPVIHRVDVFSGQPGAVGPMGEAQPIIWSRDEEVSVTQGRLKYRFGFDARLTHISATVWTAPVDGPGIVLDLNLNGTTIWTNQAERLTIPSMATDAESVLDIDVLEGDFLTLDVDDVGSTLSGEDLTVQVRYEKV